MLQNCIILKESQYFSIEDNLAECMVKCEVSFKGNSCFFVHTKAGIEMDY